jgi:predicted alpha/beta superfamily hydrolase
MAPGATHRPRGEVVGDLRLHEMHSAVFGNTRTLRVLVPPGYDDPKNAGRRYPVLFLNDGQNLFDSTVATYHPLEWRVDEVVDSLERLGRIPPLIVVGVDNAGRQGRFHEYFPWPDQFLQPPDPDPQGARYPTFLVDEVLPFIEARYRIRDDADGRGLGGSSAGALAALYTVMMRPGVFGRLLVESPSLYLDDYHLLRMAEPLTEWPGRIFLGVGTNELNAPTCDPRQVGQSELERDVARLDSLLRRPAADGPEVLRRVTVCGRHDERAWAARLPDALVFLFGACRASVQPRH